MMRYFSIFFLIIFTLTSCWFGGEDEKSNHTDSRVNGYNVNLKSLKVSSGTLCPLFFPEKKGYNLEVDGSTATLDIIPEVADSASTVTVNNKKIAAGETFTTSLEPGQNIITVRVAAADGITVREYNVSVNRLKTK